MGDMLSQDEINALLGGVDLDDMDEKCSTKYDYSIKILINELSYL